MHEYTVIGHPRQKVIFFVAIVSVVVSNFISDYVYQWLKQFFNITLTFTISSSVIFAILYVFFNQFLWKSKIFEKIFHFPNLEGEWKCTGLSNNISLGQKFDWEGTIVIKQSWDKILISLKTKSSSSQSKSVTGGLRYFAGVGYELSYHYENTPNASRDGLQKHEGFCILTFSPEKEAAGGCYFNNIKDRQSYGEMNLKRRKNKNAKVKLFKSFKFSKE